MAEANRVRKRRFTVWLMDEEWEVLQAKKDEAEMSQSEYIRNMILFGAAHERTLFSKADTKAMLYELNRIGNNINQIAYMINSSHSIAEDTVQQLTTYYGDLLGQFECIIFRE